jgi:hypothetical protein
MRFVGLDGKGATFARSGREAQRPVRAVPVVVIDEDPQHVLEVAAVGGQQPVGPLSAHRACKAPATASALGASIGVLMTSIPSLRKTSSKTPLNFASLLRIRSQAGTCLVRKLPDEVPRVLGNPGAGWRAR